MKTSDYGVKLIKGFEGLRLEAYQDAAGIWTIGYGHTGQDVREGDTITEAEAERLLRLDLTAAELAVTKLVTVPLNQHQFDALVSFTYNLGAGNLRGSTLLRLLNDGNYEHAAQQFGLWVHAGGLRLEGLVKRRAAERELFEHQMVTAEQPPAPVEERKLPLYSPDRKAKGLAMPAPLVVPILSSLVPVLVPKLVELLPELSKIFGDRERKSTDQYISAGVKVLETITQATGARNAQEAVEKVAQDAEAREAARGAVKAIWFELQEFGGGVAAAREFAIIGAPHYADVLKNVTYGALGFLALANAGVFASVVIAVLNASEHAQTLMNLGSMVVQADIGAALTAFGFWLGSSVAKTRVDEPK